jgi:hypothetical protein
MPHRLRSRILYAVKISIASALLVLSFVSVWSSRQHTLQLEQIPESLLQKQQQQLGGQQRRRLLEKVKATLSPAAKYAIRAANEAAKANAKAQGFHIHEEAEDSDPFSISARGQGRMQHEDDHHSNSNAREVAWTKELEDNVTQWTNLDPIINGEIIKPTEIRRIRYHPGVAYMGVVVDASRHYFPMDWLKKLVVYLAKIRFNLIILRLTDDEGFAVKLKSYPQLAYSMTEQYYTPKQLKNLVAFAKEHDVTIVPEIDVPLRAASWAGIPGLVVPCANYICDLGHIVPLNIHHPEFTKILKGVLTEVIEIFDSPPMLHLGGTTSLRNADECLEEAGITKGFDWESFEDMLSTILNDISYPEERVIRNKVVKSGDDDDIPRDHENGQNQKPEIQVGGIVHYWNALPRGEETQKDEDEKNKEAKEDKEEGGRKPEAIISAQLDFSQDNGDNFFDIYRNTNEIMNLPNKPKALVVGTLYLTTELWFQRNVASRLIAVVMAAAAAQDDTDRRRTKSPALSLANFPSSFQKTCHSILVAPSSKLCDLNGEAVMEYNAYIKVQMHLNKKRKDANCKRVAVGTTTRVFKPFRPDQNYASQMGNEMFFTNFHRPVAALPLSSESYKEQKEFKVKPNNVPDIVKKLGARKTKKTGIILDLANSLGNAQRVLSILQGYIVPLGLDLLQLRISDDFAFGVKLQVQQKLGQSLWSTELSRPIPKVQDFAPVVQAAKEYNVEVFPEITITTNAGGWVRGGFLVNCPLFFCKRGDAIPNDISNPQLLPVVYSVLREVREVFSNSTYFHLGADERVDTMKCYEEAGLLKDEDPPFGIFEAKLEKLVTMLGIDPGKVLRWDNGEQLSYKDRVGGITHYRVNDDPEQMPDIREEEPYFVTADILEGSSFYTVYKRTRDLVALKPVGIMGELRTLDEEIWKAQHVGLRLLSFLLGLSSSSRRKGRGILSHADFNKQVLKLCQELNFPEYEGDPKCNAAREALENSPAGGEGNDDEKEEDTGAPATAHPIANSKFRESLCSEWTRERQVMSMKEEFLLPKTKT